MLRRFGVYAGFIMLSASAVLAQTSGTIVGTVHDASGAEIAGATITVTNIARGTTQTMVSGQDGNYVIPFLPPGNYRVGVEKVGFQRQDSPHPVPNFDRDYLHCPRRR